MHIILLHQCIYIVAGDHDHQWPSIKPHLWIWHHTSTKNLRLCLSVWLNEMKMMRKLVDYLWSVMLIMFRFGKSKRKRGITTSSRGFDGLSSKGGWGRWSEGKGRGQRWKRSWVIGIIMIWMNLFLEGGSSGYSVSSPVCHCCRDHHHSHCRACNTMITITK